MLLQEARFDLSRNILVTDHGYSTLMNVQKILNLELSFLQGVRITEDAIELAFDKHVEALKNGAFYDGDLGVCAYTYAEDWQQNCSCGRLNAKVKVHLYRMDKVFDEQRALIWKKASEIISLLRGGRRVPFRSMACLSPIYQGKSRRTRTKNLGIGYNKDGSNSRTCFALCVALELHQ